MMNKFPYNNGDLMIVPKRHCSELEQLRHEETEDLFFLLKASTLVLKKTLKPHGLNIGINIGFVGGAGEKHIHFHIVPRWNGDTNFMPAIGEMKVISQELSETKKKLIAGYEEVIKK